jgi:hypothetical protein
MAKNIRKKAPDAAMCESVCESDAPSGGNGAPTAPPACRCGAGASSTNEHRCANGHLLPGHPSQLIVGHRSVAFWNAAQDALSELVGDVLRDHGYSPDDAPRALLVAAEGFAQAKLIADAAFDRLRVVGGPLSDRNDRARRAFTVWESASASVERHAKLLGLKRRTKHVDPLEALHRAVERANAK